MFKQIFRYILVFVGVLLLSACAKLQPIVNYQNQAVPKTVSIARMQQGILMSGKEIGWHMKTIKPGLIHGWIDVRGHYAAININYSSTKYSINYDTSRNLMASDGQIHRNYNKWVTLLNKKIQSHLVAKTGH